MSRSAGAVAAMLALLLAMLVLLAAAESPAARAPAPATAPPAAPEPTDGTADAPKTPKTKLVQCHAIFRHGARTPTEPYPGDPYSNRTYFPYGWGHLTRNGRRGMFHLGHLLRRRYVGAGRLLAAEYATGTLLARTSQVERTQESAACVLAGMFPPGAEQSWTSENTKLGSLWMPIPYRVMPSEKDRAIAGSVTCAARDQEMRRVYASPEYQERFLALLGGSETLRYIEEHVGMQCGDEPACIMAIFSALRSQDDLNMTLPDWTARVFPEPLGAAANLWLQAFSFNPLLRRLSYGDLTNWVLEAARGYASAPRMHLYSGHDTTVTAALQIFHLEPHGPQAAEGSGIADYGAHLLVEVHLDEQGALALQFFYRRVLTGPLVRMLPRGCGPGPLCPLERLRQLLADADELPREDDSCDAPTSRLMRNDFVNHHLKHARLAS